jgi:uncharacterized protein (TIRG00374 family)
VVAIVAHLGDARQFAELLKRARPAWLVLALAFQVGTYFCAGGIWWIVLRGMSSPQPLRLLVRLSVAKVFTDQALPAGGVTGDALMVRAVVSRGTPVSVATTALVVSLLGFYADKIVSTLGSLLVLWTQGRASPILVGLTVLLLILGATVSAGLILMVRGDRIPLQGWLARKRPIRELLDSFAQVPRDAPRDPRLLSSSFAIHLANTVLDAATLQAALASVGQHVGLGAAFATYAFASIVAMVPVSPGGLGTFEGTCVALLHQWDIGLEPALAGTLLFRGLTFWLPMVPGMAIARGELGQGKPGSS